MLIRRRNGMPGTSPSTTQRLSSSFWMGSWRVTIQGLGGLAMGGTYRKVGGVARQRGARSAVVQAECEPKCVVELSQLGAGERSRALEQVFLRQGHDPVAIHDARARQSLALADLDLDGVP